MNLKSFMTLRPEVVDRLRNFLAQNLNELFFKKTLAVFNLEKS
jgi:hypothetical protein